MGFLGRVVDERFLAHRRRSTSIAGICCAVLALALFEWRYVVDGVLNWDLFAVGAAFVAVKLALMAWQRFND